MILDIPYTTTSHASYIVALYQDGGGQSFGSVPIGRQLEYVMASKLVTNRTDIGVPRAPGAQHLRLVTHPSHKPPDNRKWIASPPDNVVN